MKHHVHGKDDQERQVTTPDTFFESIEIEFLIHELKNPNVIIETGVRTLLERRKKYGSLTAHQEKILKRILRSVRKSRDMLYNLLEIGKSETGCLSCTGFQPARAVFDSIMNSLETTPLGASDEFIPYDDAERVHAFLIKRGIVLSVAKSLHSLVVFQDQTKFRQIVGNLIKNALHHRRKRVEVDMACENDLLVVKIADDGPGIAPEHHDLVFRRYTQVHDPESNPRKGHGLGLAGAFILTRSLGGELTISRRKGGGAAFCISLPISFGGSDLERKV